MVIPRALQATLRDHLLNTDKGLILYGARQVGKTTLVRTLLAELGLRARVVSGDEADAGRVLSSRDLTRLRDLVSGHDVLFVDEAQRIPEIGLNLKLLLDNEPKLKIIATGSSSLGLASHTQEALTGRVYAYTLYPITIGELLAGTTAYDLRRTLPERLVFGNYPELFSLNDRPARERHLSNLADNYLYKDVFELGGLRYPHKLRDLLRLLAFQIGNLVNLSELGTALGMSKDTVATYIDLLEQSFVLFRLRGFSRNLRKELTKQFKVYFWDTGMRNAVIGNYADLDLRNDRGALWENWAMAERVKHLRYHSPNASVYFWRTYDGAEIDLIEEEGDALRALEFKSSPGSVRAPRGFVAQYPTATFTAVTADNALGLLSG